jgi:hypothetical protein
MKFCKHDGTALNLKVPVESLRETALFFHVTSLNHCSISADGERIQMRSRRSIGATFDFCRRFHNCSVDEVAVAIVELCEAGSLLGHFCHEIRQIVFIAGQFRPNYSEMYRGISLSRVYWEDSFQAYTRPGYDGPLRKIYTSLDQSFREQFAFLAQATNDSNFIIP